MNAHGSHTGSKDTDGFVAAVLSQLGLPSIPSLPAPFFLFLSLSLFSLFLLLFLKYSSKSAILSFSRIARISFLTISISMALNFHKCRTIDVLRRAGSFDSVAMELLFGFY